MGAFNVEIYRLGYRLFSPSISSETNRPIDTFTSNLHVAQVPCPGHCGKKCPNHHCPAHNHEKYSLD